MVLQTLIETDMNPVIVLGAGVVLAIMTAATSINWPSSAAVVHLVWLAVSLSLVIVLMRHRTSDLSGWRRVIVCAFGTIAIMAAYTFVYVVLLIEYGTSVLGWRP